MDYQSKPVEPGKWYVSDTGPTSKGSSPGKRGQIKGGNDQRLDGPFDTEAEAVAARKRFAAADSRLKGNRLYVWQADLGALPRDRMMRVIELLDMLYGQANRKLAMIYPPSEVLEDFSLLETRNLVERLEGTEWRLHFEDGGEETIEFVDLLVFLHNMIKVNEDRKRAKERLKRQGLSEGEVQFKITADLNGILPPDCARKLLRGVRIDLGPHVDPDKPEPKLTEIFNDSRMQKCTAVYQKILNNWIETRIFDCRIIADDRLEGKELHEFGGLYFAIGIGQDLTRLPMMDALIVMDLIKQYHVHLRETGEQLERMQMKTEYTQTEVFNVLDEMRRAGIRIEVASDRPN